MEKKSNLLKMVSRIASKIASILLAALLALGACGANSPAASGPSVMVRLGNVDEETERAVNQAIDQAEAERRPVLIGFDSEGGSVPVGKRIAARIERARVPVTCVVKEAASMALVIFQSCPTRMIRQDGKLMWHQTSVLAITMGWQADDFQRVADDLRREDEELTKRVMRHSIFPTKVLLALIQNGRDVWWDAREALAWGLVDGIQTPGISAGTSFP